MSKWSKTLAALGIAGAVTFSVIGFVQDDQPPLVLDDCEVGEVSLLSKYDKKGVPHEKVCMSQGVYSSIKAALVNDFNNKAKGYDFEIFNRELLMSVLDKEMRDQNFSFKGIGSKQELGRELINLLK